MSKSKPRLGRGLSSLMTLTATPDLPPRPASDPPSSPAGMPDSTGLPPGIAVRTVRLDTIVPNPHQPRKEFNVTTLAELAASIQANGLIQPVLLRPTAAGQYELIAGERRWRAARQAGLTDLPAIIRDVDPLAQAQLALIENVQREDLNPIDRAAAYQYLLNELGLTQADLANRLGEDRSTIANFVRLMDLTPPVRQLVREGKLSVGHAKLLASLPHQEQQRLAGLVLAQGLSVRNLERLIAQTPPPPKAPPSAHIKELERSITRQVGLRAQLQSTSKSKGRLTLHYTTLDQFDTLLERLGVRLED